jgi:glycosyltransferase involved in cell wall biosynthesis
MSIVAHITPTYNRAKFLESRYLELKAQTYPNWTWVVVDDGSSDNTEQVVRGIGATDYRVFYIKLDKNSGSVSIPRAVGICNSKSEFICPADDDVVIFSDKTQRLIETIGDNPLCYGGRCEIRNGNDVSYSNIENWNPLARNGWGVDNGQMMYRRSVYSHIPIKFPKRGCDWELAKQIRGLGEFSRYDGPVCGYVWHGGNRSHDESTKTREIYPEMYKEWFCNYNVEW